MKLTVKLDFGRGCELKVGTFSEIARDTLSCSCFIKWERWMVAALVCVAVVLGIYPIDRTVWCVGALHLAC